MAWSKMTSLELTDEDKIDSGFPCGPDMKPKTPDFPWGCRISLTEKELDKLGLDVKDAEVGDEVELRASARVTCISQDERDGQKCCRIELQIERMAVEGDED